MSEKIDIFDENYNFIGIEYKDKAHKEGLWHHAFRCWIVNKKTNKVIFQLRHPDKYIFPNKLDMSVAGHIQAGETILEGIREIEEEIGLKVKSDSLIQIDTDCTVNITENVIDKEFHENYLLESDLPLSYYTMQPDEVNGLFEIKIDDVIRLFSNEIKEITIKGISRLTKKEVIKTITCNDFAGHGTNYYINTFKKLKKLSKAA